VVRYLSPEWIAALDDAARADPALAAATHDVVLVVQQEVDGGPDGDAHWHVRLDHGDVRVLVGPAERADVVFRQDHATALAVARGELSAQTAFMIGKLRVSGDVDLLMAHHDLFDSVDDVFTAVRAVTEY
jgi:SCP-2 sterol transfer family